MPIGIMLKSKNARETLKAKCYDLNQVETGKAEINEDWMRLLEKLADYKPLVHNKGEEEPEFTKLRSNEADGSQDSSIERKLMVKKLCSHWLRGSLRTYLRGLWSERRK